MRHKLPRGLVSALQEKQLKHEEGKAAAQKLFLQIPSEKQHLWMTETLEEPVSPTVKLAQRFIMEAKLAKFVLKCNEQGFAPNVHQLNAELALD